MIAKDEEHNKLQAEKRDRIGGSAGRSLRRKGLIPAIIYGGDHDPLPITINGQSLERARRVPGFSTRLLHIDVSGYVEKVLPREIQYDPLTDAPLHVDFLRVTDRAVISIEVPVRFLGEERAPGIKRGGVLNVIARFITLLCPADRIPGYLDIDISQCEIGDSLHVSALSLPEGVKLTTTVNQDFTIATIIAPTIMTEIVEEQESEN